MRRGEQEESIAGARRRGPRIENADSETATREVGRGISSHAHATHPGLGPGGTGRSGALRRVGEPTSG